MRKFAALTLAAICAISFLEQLLAPHTAFADSPPTFVQEAETTWTPGAVNKTTASFDVLAGDVLVAYGIAESFHSSVSCQDDPMTISGGSLIWNNERTVQVNDYTWVGIWTTTVDSNKSMTVTFADGDGVGGCLQNHGGNVFTFRGSSGVGASNSTNVLSGAPTLNLTTTAANSAIVVANGDWDVQDGSSRSWRTNAGTYNEQTYTLVSGLYVAYGGYHPDAGAIGTYAVGLSAPSTQKYSIAAVEVKGMPSTGRIMRLRGKILLHGNMRLR